MLYVLERGEKSPLSDPGSELSKAREGNREMKHI